jgi:predicted transcriptional regulator
MYLSKDMSFMKDYVYHVRYEGHIAAQCRTAGCGHPPERKEKGLSQSALAAQLGVERKWVLRLEAGNPKAEFALVLRALELVALRVVLRDFARMTQKNRPEPSRVDEVFARLQRRDTK